MAEEIAVDKLRGRGLQAYACADYRAAAWMLSKYLEEWQEDDVEVRIRLGWSYLKLGYPESAERELRWATDLEPYNHDAVCGLALLLSRRGEEESLLLLRRLLEANSDSPEIHLALGECHQNLGNPAGAMHEYRIVLMRSPANEEAAMRLCRLLAEAENWLEGEQCLAGVLSRNPKNVRARDLYALCQYHLGNLEAAEAEWSEVLDLEPTHEEALHHLAKLLLQKQDYGKAIETFRDIVKKVPDHVEAHYALGVFYSKAGFRASAVAAWSEALKFNTDHEKTQRRLLAAVKHYFREGDLEAARKILALVIEYLPLSEERWKYEEFLREIEHLWRKPNGRIPPERRKYRYRPSEPEEEASEEVEEKQPDKLELRPRPVRRRKRSWLVLYGLLLIGLNLLITQVESTLRVKMLLTELFVLAAFSFIHSWRAFLGWAERRLRSSSLRNAIRITAKDPLSAILWQCLLLLSEAQKRRTSNSIAERGAQRREGYLKFWCNLSRLAESRLERAMAKRIERRDLNRILLCLPALITLSLFLGSWWLGIDVFSWQAIGVFVLIYLFNLVLLAVVWFLMQVFMVSLPYGLVSLIPLGGLLVCLKKRRCLRLAGLSLFGSAFYSFGLIFLVSIMALRSAAGENPFAFRIGGRNREIVSPSPFTTGLDQSLGRPAWEMARLENIARTFAEPPDPFEDPVPSSHLDAPWNDLLDSWWNVSLGQDPGKTPELPGAGVAHWELYL